MTRSDNVSTNDFYGRLAVFSNFSQLTDPEIYEPLPEGWVLGLADIVQSTAAIGLGRYKAVNTAAASVIAAVANAMSDQDFPFAFGGDGASFALPPECAQIGREALAGVATWVRAERAYSDHPRRAREQRSPRLRCFARQLIGRSATWQG
jgi:hypothetical protein